MSIFVLADTHLSQDLDKEMDIFGHRWTNYTEKLVSNWTKTVSPEDTVILPGDISWGMTMDDALSGLRLLDSLPGKKILLRGNHDFWWGSLTKMRAYIKEKGITTIDFLFNNAYLVEGKRIVGSRGWFYDQKLAPKTADFDKIVAREAGRLRLSITAARRLGKEEDEMLCFLHFPPVFKDQVATELVAVLKENGIRRCFFGHIHGVYDLAPTLTYEDIDFTLISADFLSFTPLKIEEIPQKA